MQEDIYGQMQLPIIIYRLNNHVKDINLLDLAIVLYISYDETCSSRLYIKKES